MARTVAQVSSVDAVIKSIRLNESGVITVTKHDGASHAFKLSESNRNDLLNSALTLTETETTVEQRQYVCEIMMVPTSIQNLNIIDLNTGKLRLVLSPASCAFLTYTHPADASSLDLAKSFKAQLITLARQVVASQEYVTPNLIAPNLIAPN